MIIELTRINGDNTISREYSVGRVHFDDVVAGDLLHSQLSMPREATHITSFVTERNEQLFMWGIKDSCGDMVKVFVAKVLNCKDAL